MAVTNSLAVTQESQSIINNYSTVRILWKSTQEGASYNDYTRTAYYYVSINGGAEAKYSVSYTLPKASTVTIVDTKITVPHNSGGEGSVKVRTWMDTRLPSSGTVEQTKTLTLTTIPRCSSLAVAPYGSTCDLGVPVKVTVTQQATSMKHSIRATCGDYSYYINATGGSSANEVIHNACNLNWSAPLDFAYQSPTGKSVSVIFTIATYNGSVCVGTKQTTAAFYMPSNKFTPPIACSTTDAMGYKDDFDDQYIQGKSKLNIAINTYGVYGSWITSYKTEFEGKAYTSDNVTTDVISGSGNLSYKVTITDSRGFSRTETIPVTVLPYSPPKVQSFTTFRCGADGKASDTGEYVAVKFSASITYMPEYMTTDYAIKAKKASEANYTSIRSSNIEEDVCSDTAIFAADPASSYEVVLIISDALSTVERTTAAASTKKVWSMLKKAGDIVGIAINKIAELEGVFDIGMQTRFSGGLLHPVLPTNRDLNAELTPKTYMLLSANTYANAPENGIGMFLEIVGKEGTSLIQKCSVFDTSGHREYERIYYDTNGWEDWKCVRGDFVVEQGSKDGWTYRKWNSGVAECWKIHEFTTTISTTFGSLYCGNAANRVSYPFSFTEKPVENVTLQSGSTQAILYCEASGYGVNGTSASARYNVFKPSAVTTAQTFYLSFHVTGKWK